VASSDEKITTEDLAGTRTDEDLKVENESYTEVDRGPRDTGQTDTGSRDEAPIRLDEGTGEKPKSIDPDQDRATRQSADATIDVETSTGPLLPDSERDEFVGRWREVQTRFVDEPRGAVAEADGLVAEVMKRLAQIFSEERSNLEGQWSGGEEVSTEELRVAMQRYRDFFDRLLDA
jgi:hypothetical protein